MAAVLLCTNSCQKDEGYKNEPVKQTFSAPDLELAKNHFRANSLYTNNLGNVAMRNGSASLDPYNDWDRSKTKSFKETPEQVVDILYTPRYIDTEGEIKSFIATTENEGVIYSKIFFVLYKDISIDNGLSAYVFVYNMQGLLEQNYNFQNGEDIGFPDSGTSNIDILNRTEDVNCNEIPVGTLEDLNQWSVTCGYGEVLGEVFLGTVSTDNTPQGGDAFLDGSGWGMFIPVPPTTVANPPSGDIDLVGSIWWAHNTLTPNGISIFQAIMPEADMEVMNWLSNEASYDQLEAIATFLNANRVISRDGDSDTPLDDSNGFPQGQMTEYDQDAVDLVMQAINLALENGDSETIQQLIIDIIYLANSMGPMNPYVQCMLGGNSMEVCGCVINGGNLEECFDDYITFEAPDDVIEDIEEFLECFDTSEEATITIYVDQPEASSNVAFSTFGDKAGHAFIGIEQDSIRRYFGFYPQGSADPLNPSDPHVFGNNQNALFDISITFNSNAAFLWNIIDYTVNLNIGYDLNNYNCTDYVIDIAGLCGINLPDPQSSWTGGGGSNPGAFGESLREMELPDGMTRNENGGTSLNNSGNCN